MQILTWLKRLKIIVQAVYGNSYYLNCKQIPTAEIHLLFQRLVLLCLVVFCITVDQCTMPISLTSALVGAGCSTPSPRRSTPGKNPVPIVWEARCAAGSVWTKA